MLQGRGTWKADSLRHVVMAPRDSKTDNSSALIGTVRWYCLVFEGNGYGFQIDQIRVVVIIAAIRTPRITN